MTEEEKAKRIEEIYTEAIAKIDSLSKEKNEIVKGFIKDLENKKVDSIRNKLGL